MKDNPYSKMIEIMNKRSETSSLIQIGKIISSEPLTIQIGDLQVDKDNILVADYLLPHEREITIPLTASTSEVSNASVGDHGSHTHNVTKIGVANGVIQFTDGLNTGDTVVVTTADSQTYVIIARAVSV